MLSAGLNQPCYQIYLREAVFVLRRGEEQPKPPSYSLTLTLHDGADGHAADALFQEALVDLGCLGVVGAEDGDALRMDGAI